MPDAPWSDDPHASVSLSSVFSSGTASMAEGVVRLDGLLGRDSRRFPDVEAFFPSLLLAEQQLEEIAQTILPSAEGESKGWPVEPPISPSCGADYRR